MIFRYFVITSILLHSLIFLIPLGEDEKIQTSKNLNIHIKIEKDKDTFYNNPEVFDQKDYDNNILGGEWDDDFQGNCQLNIGI